MQKRKAAEGSITVMASLSIMLIAALLFSMLELGRVAKMKMVTQASCDAAIESIFAHYNPTLWEEYHLLLLDDGGSGPDFSLQRREAYAKNVIDQSFDPENTNQMFACQAGTVSLDTYTLIGDSQGQVFEETVCSYMENNLAYEAMTQLEDLANQVRDLEESDSDVEGQIQNLQDILKGLGGNAGGGHEIAIDICRANRVVEQDIGSGSGEDSGAESIQLPGEAEWMASYESQDPSGILRLVMPGDTALSAKSLEETEVMSERAMWQGTFLPDLDGSVIDTVVVENYLLQYLSSFQKPKENRGLDYEIEYVICGEKSDEENLKSIVNRLLLIRETANFLYALTDSSLQAEAGALAAAISVVTWTEEFEEAIKYGILAFWAYVESILDLRALMAGKKVPLFKTSALWTSELSNIGSLISGSLQAKESETGLSYQNYLAIFLFLEGQENRSNRALDVMEATVRRQEENPNFYIDHCIVRADLQVQFNYHSAFLGLDAITRYMPGGLQILQKSSYSYWKAGV